MILDLIAIFRARKHPRQATKLAARFAQGQAIDRLATPIILAQLVLWAIAVLMAIIVVLAVFGGATVHGSILFIALLPALIGCLAAYIAMGIGKGLEMIKERIAALSDRGVDRLASRRTGIDATAPNGSPDDDTSRP